MASKEHDKRVIVYPHYITAGKTVAEGRRIPKSLACENPNVVEMFDCCKYLKLPAIIEDKHYPRDWFIRGRLRIQLKNDDGTLVNPEVPDRRTLLVKISELVPKHPARSKGGKAMNPHINMMDAFAAAEAALASGSGGASGSGAKAAAAAAAPAAAAGGSNKKKKGKK